MAVGGPRPGSGRPRGALSKVTTKAREAAMETGLLPHEWLLKVSRGEPILHTRLVTKYNKNGDEVKRELVEEWVYADFDTRIDAAKSAAPYYAARLATQVVSIRGDGDSGSAVADAMKAIAAKLPV
jgi:hypothetical protein